MIKGFPEILNTDDMLYHYTSMDVAIQDILHTKKLKLSQRTDSFDPIERFYQNHSIGSADVKWNAEINEFESIRLESEKEDELMKYIAEFSRNMKQVCFCQNDKSVSNRNFRVNDAEYFGCVKPRMWDNYGDRYRGCCLVFSRSKLLKSFKLQDSGVVGGSIQYVPYNLLENRYSNLDVSGFMRMGENAYKATLAEREINYLLMKHEDYLGENEFRIFTFSKEQQALYFNFQDALVAICYSEQFLKPFHRNYFDQFFRRAENKGIKRLRFSWNEKGLQIL